MKYYYTTSDKQREYDLKRHQFLKNRYFFFFKRKKPIILLNKYQRWKKIAQTLKLSKEAKRKLEWIIYYYTRANQNILKTSRHFDISPKTFYKWFKRFQDGKNFIALEEKSSASKRI